MRRYLTLLGAACIVLSASGWEVLSQGTQTQPGDPLPGISPADFELFRHGLEDFLEVKAVSGWASE